MLTDEAALINIHETWPGFKKAFYFRADSFCFHVFLALGSTDEQWGALKP